jgi:hypothetical protein
MKNGTKKSKASKNNKGRSSERTKMIEAVSWYLADYCIRAGKTGKQ